jgi:non-specific serine/threonine protein kinase
MPRRARPRANPVQTLTRIARAVSDRQPVEWEAELERAPEIGSAIDRLRRLQSLVTVHSGHTIDPHRVTPSPDPSATTEIPRGSWGSLEILESVGRGGFGHVFRAWDSMLEREVALKLWRRDRGDSRALLEARALARVRHPNLPVVHGADEHEGWMGMWTDLVRGRTLEEEIRDDGPLGAREAAQVGVEVCRALAAVHGAGLVHRDVKTSNVMREPSGRVVLLDFGLAVESAADVGSGRAAGTPPSMAPEVLRGAGATVASDLYAVGVLLYRLVSRAHPYEGRTAVEVGRLHDRREAVALHRRRPDLPPTFVRIVDRALSHSPEGRYADASSLERALLEFLGAVARELDAAAPVRPGREDPPLPHFLTRFIGRDDELAQCHDALGSHRLVTLVGPGGSGKTRLSVRAAEAMSRSGVAVAFVDLSSLTEAATVEPEVRRALETHPIGVSTGLLVLDNCEHLVDPLRGLVGNLLSGSRDLTLLATSRSPLGVPGERVLHVPPLSMPPADASGSVESVSSFDAVRLFVERAGLVRPDFQLTARNAAAVAEVCRRADGLPLAIELAAARARALSPEEIRDHLASGSRLLARGGFSTTARHESLEAAIRWTYDSLPEDLRALMNSLAIFTGTWSLPAVAAICASGASDLAVLEAVTSLIEQSLVTVAPPCFGVTRYRLLDTLRGFALERLAESGRLHELEERHFDYFLALAEEAEPSLWGPEQASWIERLDADHPNLQSALSWARGRAGRAIDHLRLAGALARFWSERGHLSTGREALDSALGLAEASEQPLVRARALLGASTLAIYQSDAAQARVHGVEALERYRALGDREGIARTRVTLGIIAHEISDYVAAETSYRESLDLFRQLGDERGEAHVLNNLGAITWRQERWDEARRLHREALDHAEPARDPGLRALALTNLGFVARHLGHTSEAATCLAEALALVREHRLMRHAASTLEAAAAVLAQQHESARAARLYAAAGQLRVDLGNRQEPAWRRAHEPMMAAADRDLGPERLESESRAGRSLGLRKALEEAARGLELIV